MYLAKTGALPLAFLCGAVLTAGPSLARQPQAANPAPTKISVVYNCDNGDTIAATFPKFPATGPAILSFHGRKIVLPAALSADGARYLADSGLTQGKVLELWIKGDGATLSEGPLDQGDDGSKTLVARCHVIGDHR